MNEVVEGLENYLNFNRSFRTDLYTFIHNEDFHVLVLKDDGNIILIEDRYSNFVKVLARNFSKITDSKKVETIDGQLPG